MRLKKWLGLVTLLLVCLTVNGQQPQTSIAPLFAANAKYANGVAPGYWPTAGSGLTLNLSASTANCGGGSVVTYASGTLTMTASTTNYVYLNTASSCVPAVKTTAFTGSDVPIAVVVTSGSAITSITDDRTMFGAQSGAPSGAAGGDLCGTYPNPCVAKVNGGALPLSSTYVGTDAGGKIVAAPTPSGGGGSSSSGSPNAIPLFGDQVPGFFGGNGLVIGTVYQNSLSSPVFLQGFGTGVTETIASDSSGFPSAIAWSASTSSGFVQPYFAFVPSGLNYIRTAGTVSSATAGAFYKLPNLTDSGDIVLSRALSTVYQNTTGNLVFVVVNLSSVSDAAALTGISDGSSSPTAPKWATVKNGTGVAAMLFAVLPGDYYEVTASSGTLAHWNEYQVNISVSQSANLTGSRAAGTVYQNTGTKDVFVDAGFTNSATGSSTCQTAAVSTGTYTLLDDMSSSSRATTMQCVVHPGWYYKILRDAGTTTLSFWYEYTLG